MNLFKVTFPACSEEVAERLFFVAKDHNVAVHSLGLEEGELEFEYPEDELFVFETCLKNEDKMLLSKPKLGTFSDIESGREVDGVLVQQI